MQKSILIIFILLSYTHLHGSQDPNLRARIEQEFRGSQINNQRWGSLRIYRFPIFLENHEDISQIPPRCNPDKLYAKYPPAIAHILFRTYFWRFSKRFDCWKRTRK